MPPHSNLSPAGGEGLFGAAAARLATAAAQMLGWRPNEFWAATPMELATALGLPEEGELDRAWLDALTARLPD